MNILHVTPYFHPASPYGGTPRAVYYLTRSLAQRGHQVTVWTTDTFDFKKRITDRQKRIGKVNVYYFPNISNALLRYVKFPFCPAMRRRIALLSRFDLVHLHELRTYPNIVIGRQAYKKNIPYVLTAHGSLPYHRKFVKAKRIFDFCWGKRIAQQAKGLLALTPPEVQAYLDLGVSRGKIYPTHNGVLLTRPAWEKQKEFRKAFHLQDTPYLLFLGRLHPMKGLAFLIRVFAQVHKKLPRLKLVLAGPDENYQAILQKKVIPPHLAPSIVFTGPLSGSLKQAALKQAEVFVFPSRFEAFPLAPLEAIAQKTPVIISDRCGIAPFFRQKKLGLVLAYDDVTAWTQAIIKMIHQALKNAQAQEQAYLYVRTHLTWGQVARQHEKIYRQVISA